MTDRRPTLLVVDDDPDFVAVQIRDLRSLDCVSLGATSLRDCKAVLDEHFVDLLLLDEQLGRESGTAFLADLKTDHPGLTAIIVSGHADLDLVLKAMRSGAADVLPKPFTLDVLQTTVHRALTDSRIVRDARYHRWYAQKEARFPEIVGESAAIREVQALIRRAGAVNSGVVIEGESGTGKDLVAMAIHGASSRRHQPMLTRNIASITPELVGAELFGSRRGAFTGAEERAGLFEAANGGTLFLDEIGDAPPAVQATLLRVLEARKVARLGDTKERATDVRLVVATNRNLLDEVRAKRFREDLYHRLGAVHIHLPPLRRRIEDIELIAGYLLERQNVEQGRAIKGFDNAALDMLRQYRWPGNIRELRNVVEGAVIYCDGDTIRPADLRIRGTSGRSGVDEFLDWEFLAAANEFECRYFDRAIERANGNKAAAARLAGLERSVFYGHLKRLKRSGED